MYPSFPGVDLQRNTVCRYLTIFAYVFLIHDFQYYLYKMTDSRKDLYISPLLKMVLFKSDSLICQSGGINSMNVDDDGGEAFN